MESPLPDIAEILNHIRAGDETARHELFRVVYSDLRDIAHRQRRLPALDETLGTTALVHEAYLRLVRSRSLETIESRTHFFATAVRVMRQVLVDHARERKAIKRGGDRQRLPVDLVLDQIEASQRADFVDLDEALEELGRLDARQMLIVSLRFFAGMTLEQVAEQLEMSVTTVHKDYRSARAFLHLRLRDAKSDA